MTQLQILEFFALRSLCALMAGLILGIERTLSLHAAGIKTLAFVAMGSGMFASLSFYLYEIYPHTDPTRIIGQIVTGIGFLGAGVIFKSGAKVEGLTSSAMIWAACALGTIAGTGLYLVSIFAAITVVCITLFLRKFEKFVEEKAAKDKKEEKK